MSLHMKAIYRPGDKLAFNDFGENSTVLCTWFTVMIFWCLLNRPVMVPSRNLNKNQHFRRVVYGTRGIVLLNHSMGSSRPNIAGDHSCTFRSSVHRHASLVVKGSPVPPTLCLAPCSINNPYANCIWFLCDTLINCSPSPASSVYLPTHSRVSSSRYPHCTFYSSRQMIACP